MTPVRSNLSGTLAVATLDILDAIVFFGMRSGTAPIRIFQSIAADLRGTPPAVTNGHFAHLFLVGLPSALFARKT